MPEVWDKDVKDENWGRGVHKLYHCTVSEESVVVFLENR